MVNLTKFNRERLIQIAKILELTVEVNEQKSKQNHKNKLLR